MKLSEWVSQGADPARLHECVKPLEWEFVGDKWGTYCANGYSATTRLTAPYINVTGPSGEDLGVYDHSEDAKAAAQAHYAEQIIAGFNL